MAKLLKLRRGTTSQHSSFTGAEGEVTVDTTKDTLVVHDGSTAGGVPLAKESANLSLIDEDNMSTNSATRPPSQQSVKAYVDTADALKANLSGATFTGDVTLTGDSANVVWDKSDNALEFAAGANITLEDQNIIRFTNGASGNSSGNEGIMFGASGSELLKIFNWGASGASTKSRFESTATNGLAFKGPKFQVQNTVPNDIIYSDGAYVKLYYSDGTNSAEKLATSSSGVSVTGSLTISGGLTVNGTTTTVNTTNTTVTDNLLELNSGASSNANDAGILIERGSTGDNAIIAWDESADKFTVGTTTGTASSTGNISITTGTLVANLEGNVTGNASGTAATVTGAAQSAITSVGTLTGLTSTGTIDIDSDSAKLRLGGDQDLEVYHDGADGYVYNTLGTGNLFIQGDAIQIRSKTGTEEYIVCNHGGGVDIYHDDEKVFNTKDNGIEVRNTNGKGELNIIGSEGNGAELILTADDGDDWTDLSRLHQGNDGTLYIQNLTASSTWEKMVTCVPNAEVSLFYNNNEKFRTLDTGGRFLGSEGGVCDLELMADEGDDNADKWRFQIDTSGNFKVDNYSTGSWANGLQINGSNNATFAGTVSDSKGDLRKIPINAKTSSYTLISSDAGKTIRTDSGVTVPSGVFYEGEAITIFNNSGSDITITQGSSQTMYLGTDASTGNRTLAGRGVCTVLCVSNNVFVISGAGLS